MFTGIVQGLCQVADLQRLENLMRLKVEMPGLTDSLVSGASVAVNGVCLTVVSAVGSLVDFDVIQQTLESTNLNVLQQGDSVNIERSFKYGDEVGGHLLSGHISCCAELKKLVQAENLRELTFSVNPSYIPYLMPKGFIALDGASLTISKLDREKAEFSVSLIPETIARTTLGLERLSVSNKINLELDSSTLAVVDTVKEVLSNMDIPSRPV